MDRLQLHDILIGIPGVQKVYFQPPENLKLVYPCIVYARDRARTEFADDNPYRYVPKYQITVIAQDPDSPIPNAVARLSGCIHTRTFPANNLNHDVFTLFTP